MSTGLLVFLLILKMSVEVNLFPLVVILPSLCWFAKMIILPTLLFMWMRAFKEKNMKFRVGFAIFDPSGQIMAAGCHKINPPGLVLAAELNAILNGISFWKGLQMNTIRVFSDFMDVFLALRNKD